MARILYSLAWWLALPLVVGRLWLRGKKEPGYRRHLGERFGFYRQGRAQPFIWLHAVSVGETRAAEPLVDALLQAYPSHAILLTHMTPTGRATGQSLFGKHGARVVQSYLPYDTGWMVGRFLRYFKPGICILMETEVWPNVMAQCTKYRVPVALVNARLSERSLKKAQRFSALMTDAAHAMTCVAAQTQADAERLSSLGAPRVHVTGSVKFDVTPPEHAVNKGRVMRAQVGTRPVLLCASTREGEEALILDAWQAAPASGALLVLVPRHPQRFNEVAQMVQDRALSLVRRSTMDDAPISGDTRVLLGDSMGEMFAYYTACDLAFIGGSLMPLGGQNLIEACAVGKPVLIGQHTFNFAEVSDDAVAAGAALRVNDAKDIVSAAQRLFSADAERSVMGEKALTFARQHRGATARTMELLKPLIGLKHAIRRA